MPRAFGGSGDNLQQSGPLVLSVYHSSWLAPLRFLLATEVRALLVKLLPCPSGLG